MSAPGRRVDIVNSNFLRFHCSEDFSTGDNVEDEVVPDSKISPIKRPVNWSNVNGCEQWDRTTNPPSELGGTDIPWNANPLTRDNDVKNSPLHPKTFNPVIGGGGGSSGTEVRREARCQPHLERIALEIAIYTILSEKFYELYKKGANPDYVRETVNNLLTRNTEISAYIRKIIPEIRLTQGQINAEDYRSFMNHLSLLFDYELFFLSLQNSNGDGPYPENGEYNLWGKCSWTMARDEIFANKKNAQNEEKNVTQDLTPLSQKSEEQLENLSHVQNPMSPAANKSPSLCSPRSPRPECNEPANSEEPTKLDTNTTLMNIVSSNCVTLQEHQVEIFSLRRTMQDILLTMSKVNLYPGLDHRVFFNDHSAPLAESDECTNTIVNNSINNSDFLNSRDGEQALNNQVPPGTRSNNYVDNFRSCALQNYFDTTATVGQNQNAVCSTSTSPLAVVTNKPIDLNSSDVNLFQNIHNEHDFFRTCNKMVTPDFRKELSIITTDTAETNTYPELHLGNNNVTNTGGENVYSDLEDFSNEIDGFEFIVNPVVDEHLLSISTNNETLLKKSKARIISQMVSTYIATNKEHDDFLIRLFTELQMLSFTNKSRTELIETLEALRNKKDLDLLTAPSPSPSESDLSDDSDEVSSIELSYDDGINDSYNSTNDFTV